MKAPPVKVRLVGEVRRADGTLRTEPEPEEKEKKKPWHSD